MLHAEYFRKLEQLECLPPEAMKPLLLERAASLQMLLEIKGNLALNKSPTQGEPKMTGQSKMEINSKLETSEKCEQKQKIT